MHDVNRVHRSGLAAGTLRGDRGRLTEAVIYANQGVENTGWLDNAFIEKAAASVPGMDVKRLLDE